MNFVSLLKRGIRAGKERVSSIRPKERLKKSWPPALRRTSQLLEKKQHGEALDILVRYGKKAADLPGLGKQLRKLLSTASPEDEGGFRRKIASNLLPAFEKQDRKPHTTEAFLISHLHLLVALELWDAAYRVIASCQPAVLTHKDISIFEIQISRALLEQSLKDKDLNRATDLLSKHVKEENYFHYKTYVKSALDLSLSNKELYCAVDLLNKYVKEEDYAYYNYYIQFIATAAIVELKNIDLAVTLLDKYFRNSEDFSFSRNYAVSIARTALAKAHAMGRSDAEDIAPLQNLKIFEEFLREKAAGRTLLSSLNREVLQWLHEVQKPRAAPASPPQGRKLRILFVTADNWRFLHPAMSYFDQEDTEVRYLSFAQCRTAIDAQYSRDKSRPTLNAMLFALGPYQVSVEESNKALADAAPWASGLIDWCDVVFVEWWSAPAIWFSRYLTHEKSLIIRCHSFEAFHQNTHYANMRRVDGIIFIAEHIRQVFNSVFADLPASEGKQIVISNVRNRDHLIKIEKQSRAPFTLGMMQYATINKDPLFALDILEDLVRVDHRWTLSLIGNPWGNPNSNEERSYQEEFERRVTALSRHVLIEPFTKDTAAWHARIGFIISASHREGSHESVMDGMVTGSVPVIRRWPMVKDFGAPESVFPGVPAFETSQEAANYILECSNDFDVISRRMREHALAIYDPKDAGQKLAKFVIGCASGATS